MRITITLLALLVALLALAGCGATPRAQWGTQRDVLSATQDSLMAAHRAGKISDETLVEAAEIVSATQEYLAEARIVMESDPDEYERLMGHVRAGLQALRAYRAEANPAETER